MFRLFFHLFYRPPCENRTFSTLEEARLQPNSYLVAIICFINCDKMAFMSLKALVLHVWFKQTRMQNQAECLSGSQLWSVITYAGKCYTLQPRFILLTCITQTHTFKPTPAHTDEHLRKQMFHSKRIGAIPKSYFWKTSTHKHQHLVKDNWIALTKQTAITTRVCFHSRIKKDISASSISLCTLRFLQSLRVKASQWNLFNSHK